MITKIDVSGYVHLTGSKPGGIYMLSDFDDEELRENKNILLGKIAHNQILCTSFQEKDKMEDSIKKINEELEKRINLEAERRI